MERNNRYTDSCSDKNSIRKRALEARGSITKEEVKRKSIVICQKLFGAVDFTGIHSVALYASYNGEVDTYDLIRLLLKLKKAVYLPVSYIYLNEPCMDFYRIDSIDELAEGYKGIMEPLVRTDERRMIFGNPDVIIVPVVAFDKELNRIGYGKGFYDRFLAANSSAGLITGLAFENQRFDCVYAGERDFPLNMVVTEEKIYR